MLKRALALNASTQLVSAVDVTAQPRSVAGGIAAEQFRVSDAAVRIALRLTTSVDSHRNIGFTGAAKRDGVSATAVQVALALVQIQANPVLLIDANLRTPSLHEVFGIERQPGLSELLTENITVQEAAHSAGYPNLRVMPVGSGCQDLVRLFSSAAFSLLLDSVAEQFGFVLIDMPPVAECSEAGIIASKCDGVVIVMAAGRRTRQQLVRVKKELESVRVSVLGAVLAHVK